MGNASVDTHTGTPSAMSSPTSRSVVDKRPPPSANIVAIGGTGEAADDVSDARDATLGEELAGRERQQLSLARGDRGAEQADPQRQVQREWRSARNSGVEETPHARSRASGSSMMPASASVATSVLGASRDRPHLRGLGLPERVPLSTARS